MITIDKINLVSGTPATAEQWAEAQADAASGYDENDLQMAVTDYSDQIIQALKERRLADVGHIIQRHRLITIDRRAEFVLFGKVITKHQEVTA